MQDEAVSDFHGYKEYSACKFPSDKKLPVMMSKYNLYFATMKAL